MLTPLLQEFLIRLETNTLNDLLILENEVSSAAILLGQFCMENDWLSYTSWYSDEGFFKCE